MFRDIKKREGVETKTPSRLEENAFAIEKFRPFMEEALYLSNKCPIFAKTKKERANESRR